jgi:hypothetical protein
MPNINILEVETDRGLCKREETEYVRFFPWTMRPRTIHTLRDRLGLFRLELAGHI